MLERSYRREAERAKVILGPVVLASELNRTIALRGNSRRPTMTRLHTFLASFLLWFGSSADLPVLARLLSLACLCHDGASGPRRECMSFLLSPSRVKTFLSLPPSLVNIVALTGLLWPANLDSSCLSLEKTIGLGEGWVLLDMVLGLGFRLFLVLLFLSHDSDSES
ncbi:hypothetical protein Tco_0277595 [Tanacetum coccineum]